jgi:hypothetical protein
MRRSKKNPHWGSTLDDFLDDRFGPRRDMVSDLRG